MKDTSHDFTCGIRQLVAMLAIVVGDGGEAFRRYSDEIQDDYLFACWQKAKDLMSIAEGEGGTK